jgi:hypothetical protein
MRSIVCLLGIVIAAACLPAPALQAQEFRGTAQEATELFALDAGLAVFEMEHQGAGAFRVRLLDEQGNVVEELAAAEGGFRGSRAVRVPRGGRYLLDVSATGPWSVRRRVDAQAAQVAAQAALLPDTASPVFKAASAAADEVSTAGWLARGFVGGALAGPVGAAFAVAVAGRSGVPDYARSDGGAEYGPGFQEAFAAQVRQQRKKRAFIGGMLGSGVFLAGLIWAVDIAGGGEGGAAGVGGNGGGQLTILPR